MLFRIILFLTLHMCVYCKSTRNIHGSEYIDCIPGDLNVVLASPHGGYEAPEDIRDRPQGGCLVEGQCVFEHDCGDINTQQCLSIREPDFRTQELIRSVRQYLLELTGKAPTVSINLLTRTKLDANRDMDLATFGNPVAIEAWHEFHRCINEAKERIEASKGGTGMGLFIDVHGQSHATIRAELGYLISTPVLDSGVADPSNTSIAHLATTVDDFEALLRGDRSLGYFLEEQGFDAVPSPKYPGPGGLPYFTGGFNSRTHGSVDGGRIDGIMIESHFAHRLDHVRERYARALATSIVQYLQTNYGYEPPIVPFLDLLRETLKLTQQIADVVKYLIS